MEAIRKLSNFNFQQTKPCIKIISSIWHLFSHFSRAMNGPLPSFKNPHFQNEARCTTFLWKWVLFAWEWKMISISKAEHLPSFWNRGPGELGNGLLITPKNRSLWGPAEKTNFKSFKFYKMKKLNPTHDDFTCVFSISVKSEIYFLRLT